jgi:hypothetical protein
VNTCPKCRYVFAIVQQPIAQNPFPQSPQSGTPAPAPNQTISSPTTQAPNAGGEQRGWPLILEPQDVTEWIAAWLVNWIWLYFWVILLALGLSFAAKLTVVNFNEVLYLALLFSVLATSPIYYVLKLRRLFVHSAIASRNHLNDVGVWLGPLIVLILVAVYLFFSPVGSINPVNWNQNNISSQPTVNQQNSSFGN